MIEPQVIKKKRLAMKECTCCRIQRAGDEFIASKSWFFADGLIPVCNTCVKEKMSEAVWNWVAVDKLCQMIDIPFIPADFERLHTINGDNVFPIYAKVFMDKPFEELGWADYFEKFKELKSLKLIDSELPEIRQARVKQLQLEWGSNYEEETLTYLENLYNGMLATQNVNGALQVDQARKLCKISSEIDSRIRAGVDFDKLMGSYDKLVKTAEFTPKNSKNENDFDSFGEVAAWLERRGWLNKYFDDVTRDIVDEVIQNLQSFNQRLYINESGIGEEITSRIEALKVATNLENNYDIDKSHNLEQYENDGYDELVKEEFNVDDDDL